VLGVADDAPPRAFASKRRPDRAQLLSAPVRWPRPSRLEAALEVAPARVREAMRSIGLNTVGDLLEHLPRDRREARKLVDLEVGEQATVAVQVSAISARPVRRRGMRPLVQARVCDDTATVSATFFNQPWLVERYPPGTMLLLHGKAARGGSFNVVHHAQISDRGSVVPNEPSQTGAVGHYPATEGVSSTQIFTLVQERRDALVEVCEALPGRMRACEGLPDRASALHALHSPANVAQAERARARLAFEELLLAQLTVLRRRALRGQGSAARLDGRGELTSRWLSESLPFTLTGDQAAAIEAVDRDLGRGRPMQRLLMGEVGSGKTVVALYALLRAVEHGMQGALMAPTETLAEQHFLTLQRLVPDAMLPSALLCGSTSQRRRAETLGKLGSGELKLVVGTHALIEPDVAFAALGVVVVDEQHRFGVRQRAALDRKGPMRSDGARGRLTPHVLHMTATPIPRTLALTSYGDLDVTRLREQPSGRRPLHTRLACGDDQRARAYEQIREQVRAGRQAFVVCPLVEESEQLQARAATAEFERLAAGELRECRMVLLHGQLPMREKQRAMSAFAAGEADVLVATTVIEVGIDVPNATVMLVEDAERYGISQLHQLRGRVGRGEHASTCLLLGPRASRRLRALVEHHDGFELAEIDLRLRGEGDLAGVRQHGQLPLQVARLPQDGELLERARRWAERVLAEDPLLHAPEHTLLSAALEDAFGEAGTEPISA
jgi:ATP-dependent DNA helicase RecG